MYEVVKSGMNAQQVHDVIQRDQTVQISHKSFYQLFHHHVIPVMMFYLVLLSIYSDHRMYGFVMSITEDELAHDETHQD